MVLAQQLRIELHQQARNPAVVLKPEHRAP
jgi:hypothetical protein